MKDYIIYPALGVVAALLVIFGFNYFKSGKESGFSIASIMALDKPYICTFEKMDETSQIDGTIRTDAQKLYGEFKIKTSGPEAKEFGSFLIIKDGKSYIWTSLQSSGYVSATAKSAGAGASPQDQAQIIGTEDKLPYNCEIWQNADDYIFETPTSTKFIELKN